MKGMILMKPSIKKIIALAVSSVISVSVMTATASAEENIPPAPSGSIENYSAAPRAALPAGAYYSTSNPTSFIKIDSGVNTTCLVSLVIYDSTGNKISGTGYYYYRLNPSFNIILDSWYTIDTSGNKTHGSYQKTIPVTYNGGTIIVDATGEEFVL